MDENNFRLPETVSLTGADVSALLRLGDGDAALLYLYLSAFGGTDAPEELPRCPGLSPEALRAAESRLRSAGLLAPARAVPESAPPAHTERPRTHVPATGGEVRGEDEDGRQFYVLVQEAQRMLGRVLSSDDLIRLFGIYDTLKLPPEVILQLIRYCMSETERRDGNTRPPSVKYIEKAAYTWEREGIFSLELAEEYIKSRAARHAEAAVIKKALQINDRELTPSERKYVESWLSLGFDAEAISVAYDRTVMKTGRLAWGYMDSIIVSWHGKGLHTAADVAAKDSRPERGPRKAGAERPAPDSREFERMNRLLSELNKEKD
ncbi:MAG: DnaD domain protein [Oscillospiraceae bacterium]|jgi:DnaD/phage-associated family protein|nr:DnaD domain protein [Oscillospiraceae bacterium]